MNDQTLAKIHSSLSDLGLLDSLIRIEQIPGDLSPRRYFRCFLNENQMGKKSIMAMVFDSIQPPESEAKFSYTSDVTFIELTKFLSEHDIPVPKLYLERKDIGVLVLEDLGVKTLIEVLGKEHKATIPYYKRATELIHAFQDIPMRPDFFAFDRALEEEVYRRELQSFIKYYVDPLLDSSRKKQIEEVLLGLCAEIDKFPRVLVHRDFHSWNLMIDDEDKLRVIDFQDALMGPRCYDLVALLHERDIDGILSAEEVLEIEDSFFSKIADPKVRIYEYPRVQLQRDLKTTGLFTKCVSDRKLFSYGKWIPGNFKRIEKTLVRLLEDSPSFSPLYDLVLGYV